MRVLLWTESFWPYIGGVQVGSAQLVPALAQRGCDITVVTVNRQRKLPAEETYQGIRIRRFPFDIVLNERNLDELAELQQQVAALRREVRPDLVHVNSIGNSILVLRKTAKVHPAPTMLTLRLKPRPDSLGPDTLYGSMLRAIDWVVGCSNAVIEEARRQVPEIAHRSSAIINGLAVPDLAPAPLPFDPPTLLCLGRLAPQKGFDLALRAFRSLVARVPGIRMVVAGDGPLRADLERLAAWLELGSAVRFAGWVEPREVPALLNTATIVVMPSWNEGLPLVAIQAAQMGRPIVATRVSGNPEVVDDGNTGLLVEPGDPGTLAHAIVSLLDDPAAAERMGAAARRRALELFTLDRCTDEYYALYRQLVRN